MRTAQGQWLLLTPGTNGECGGGAGSWPAGGSRHAGYYWHTMANQSQPYGTTGINAGQMKGAPAAAILPAARLEVHTGGGVTFGYAKQTSRGEVSGRLIRWAALADPVGDRASLEMDQQHDEITGPAQVIASSRAVSSPSTMATRSGG